MWSLIGWFSINILVFEIMEIVSWVSLLHGYHSLFYRCLYNYYMGIILYCMVPFRELGRYHMVTKN